jgi:hypothetical protein
LDVTEPLASLKAAQASPPVSANSAAIVDVMLA